MKHMKYAQITQVPNRFLSISITGHYSIRLTNGHTDRWPGLDLTSDLAHILNI